MGEAPMDGAEEEGKMFTIRFWGVRGSIPTAGPRTAGVGGNTACVEVEHDGGRVFLDAGTGLREAGVEAMRRGGPLTATILLSHLHWDHIQGFPFFTPAYLPASRLTVCGMAPEGDLRGAMAAQMAAPHFPVSLEQMRSAPAFRALVPGDVMTLDGATVVTAAARHPNGALAYRVEAGGRSLVYATDHEAAPGAPLDQALVDMARGADVLIHDAQYTPEEYAGAGGGGSKAGWGHSTWREAVRLAVAARVGRLVLFHHDPGHDDEAVAAIEAAARACFPETLAAREGLVLSLADEDGRREAA